MDFGDISIASVGGIAGKNSKAEFQAPVRTTKYPKEIPPLPWYRKTAPQMAMAGFLPFSLFYRVARPEFSSSAIAGIDEETDKSTTTSLGGDRVRQRTTQTSLLFEMNGSKQDKTSREISDDPFSFPS
nr:transmembrane 9 superfamily member 3-like [Tanacetum cinerariifolium]